MKLNKKILILTYMTTVVVMAIHGLIVHKNSEHKYSIKSSFYLENINGPMMDNEYPILCFDSDEERIGFLFKIQNNNDRQVKYSIILMVNDCQLHEEECQYDTIGRDFTLEPHENKEEVVHIAKTSLNKSVNEVLLIVRQDIDRNFEHSMKSNTIFLCYKIICDEIEKNMDLGYKGIIENTVRLKAEPLGEINKSKNCYMSCGVIGVKITMEEMPQRIYKVFCLLNSEIKKMDNKPYILLNYNNGYETIVDIDITNGDYLNNIEFFAFPIDLFSKEEIIRSECYTVVNVKA